MKTSWHAIGGGAYEERAGGAEGKATGHYRARVTINHRRTWRILKSTARNAAIRESARADWIATAESFAELAKQWADVGYPGLKGTPTDSGATAKRHLDWLLKWFGRFPADEIRLKHLHPYAMWRKRFIKRGSGDRTIDIEIACLSNVLHFGVKQGILEINYIYRARNSFRKQKDIRHSYDVMPPDAETIHKIASYFLGNIRSEVMGWLCFFTPYTGLRHSELLRLLVNAPAEQPGHIHWFRADEIVERNNGLLGQLHLGYRSKKGINPYSDVFPEFAQMLHAFLNWHRQRFGPSDPRDPLPFFPGRLGNKPIKPCSFAHALRAACKELELPPVTPHGFRAYFATKHMRDGKRSVEVAFDMGDRTVAVVEQIYVKNLKGPKLWWTPPDGVPAWQKWLPVVKQTATAIINKNN